MAAVARVADDADHLPHCTGKTDGQRAYDNGVSDAQFPDLGDPDDAGRIRVVQSMTRMDFESKAHAQGCCCTQSIELTQARTTGDCIRIFAGMELDHIRSRFSRSFDLNPYRVDKETYGNARIVEALDHTFHPRLLTYNIQSPFCRQFSAAFGNESDEIWNRAQCNTNDLWRCRHFQVESRSHLMTQAMNVLIANMTPVFPKMAYDSVRSCTHTGSGCINDVGSCAAPCIAHGCNMVDIDQQADGRGHRYIQAIFTIDTRVEYTDFLEFFGEDVGYNDI